MNADNTLPQSDEYRCPGEEHAISQSVHLGRLAAFYPACRQCPRRDDTGTLSPRQVAQLAETRGRAQPQSLFHDEGAGGVYLNDLTPAAARKIAAAFGAAMIEEGLKQIREGEGERGRGGEKHGDCDDLLVSLSPCLPLSPSVLLAGDGRPLTAELVAAAAEGLRAVGCNVVDIGPSTGACLAFAVDRFQTAGGVLVGNPGSDSHTAGLKFWASGSRPLSAGGSLEPIIERYRAGNYPNSSIGEKGEGTLPFRPTRTYGELTRCQAEEPYLAQMSEHYHALRPLRVVIDSASKPTVDFLRRLVAAVACEVVACRTSRNDLARQILDAAAHFAVCIDGDGETCHALDERGRDVSPERLLLLVAQRSSAKSVVLETETSRAVIDRLGQFGMQIATSSPRRADMYAAMRQSGAVLGGGPSGRFWHVEAGLPGTVPIFVSAKMGLSPLTPTQAGLPLCDALMTVTRLLMLLSQSDEPFSEVLDRDAALG